MQYIGTKMINAEAMTRAAYNELRGWELPEGESGEDEGYLVEYLDGGKPNVPSHTGYVSWSPKEQFDAAYVALPPGSENLQPHQQRVVAEKAALDKNVEKLHDFVFGSDVFHTLIEDEKNRLVTQLNLMKEYSRVIGERIATF